MSANPLVALLSAVPVFFASIFFHEMGHALCGRAAGFRITSFGIGTGRPYWSANWGGTLVYLSFRRPYQGLAFAIPPRLFPSRWQWTCLTAGGIAANFIAAGTAVLLWRLAPGAWGLWLPVAAANLFLIPVSSIPHTGWAGKVFIRSDGLQLLHTWLFGLPGPRNETAVLRTCMELRGLGGAPGDRAIRRTYLLRAASVWLSLGDAAYARRLWDEARSLVPEPSPSPPSPGPACAGLAALPVNLSAGSADLWEEEHAFGGSKNPEDAFLVRWLRGSFLLRDGEATEAARVLDELASHPLAVRGAPLHAALLASRLAARCALSDEAGLAALLAVYERLPARRRSALADLEAYPTLAAFFRRRGDAARAGAAYASVLDAVRRLDESFTEPYDRERFRRCRTPLVAAARAYYRQLGRHDEAARLETFFPDYQARKRDAEELRQRRDDRFLRVGIALLLINVIATALSLAALGHLAGNEPPQHAPALFLLFATFSTIGATFGIVGWVWHRVQPATARDRGIGLLVLEAAPWLFWLLVLPWTGK
jgi:hypothetical protein